jgi:hypothetical protein
MKKDLKSIVSNGQPTKELASKDGCFVIAVSPIDQELFMSEICEATDTGVILGKRDGKVLANLEGKPFGIVEGAIPYSQLILVDQGNIYVGKEIRDRIYFLQHNSVPPGQ